MAQTVAVQNADVETEETVRPLASGAEGPGRAAVPRSGARVLPRLSGLANHPRPVAEFHRLPVPFGQAGPLDLVR